MVCGLAESHLKQNNRDSRRFKNRGVTNLMMTFDQNQQKSPRFDSHNALPVIQHKMADLPFLRDHRY